MPQLELSKRPETDEFAEYYGLYIGLVPDGNIVDLMKSQVVEIESLFENISEADASILHSPYTWTIKQVVGHLIDVERVFAYRALRFASADNRPILGMEQNPWVDNTDYESPTLKSLVEELVACRKANQLFFARLQPATWNLKGPADGNEMSVRALAYCLVGHIIHHTEIVKNRVK